MQAAQPHKKPSFLGSNVGLGVAVGAAVAVAALLSGMFIPAVKTVLDSIFNVIAPDALGDLSFPLGVSETALAGALVGGLAGKVTGEKNPASAKEISKPSFFNRKAVTYGLLTGVAATIVLGLPGVFETGCEWIIKSMPAAVEKTLNSLAKTMGTEALGVTILSSIAAAVGMVGAAIGGIVGYSEMAHDYNEAQQQQAVAVSQSKSQSRGRSVQFDNDVNPQFKKMHEQERLQAVQHQR